MLKLIGSLPVIASLDWMPSLTALVLRDRSRARRFLRSSRAHPVRRAGAGAGWQSSYKAS
jgi:hypothetical protein